LYCCGEKIEPKSKILEDVAILQESLSKHSISKLLLEVSLLFNNLIPGKALETQFPVK
jgi:hypothetical protein